MKEDTYKRVLVSETEGKKEMTRCEGKVDLKLRLRALTRLIVMLQNLCTVSKQVCPEVVYEAVYSGYHCQ